MVNPFSRFLHNLTMTILIGRSEGNFSIQEGLKCYLKVKDLDMQNGFKAVWQNGPIGLCIFNQGLANCTTVSIFGRVNYSGSLGHFWYI